MAERIRMKIITVLLLQTFLFCNLTFASSINDISIPGAIGSVKSSYEGQNKRLIVHIQDAHCNYEAQKNISEILAELYREHDVTLISVEGADDYVNVSQFKDFPDPNAVRKVADRYMEQGELTGPEFLSITSDYPIRLYGAEDIDLYMQNLRNFSSTYPAKEEVAKYFLGIKTVLSRLKGYIYSKELKAFDGKVEDYKAEKIGLSDYTNLLEAYLGQYSISVENYPNFAKLIKTLEYEAKIDFDAVNRERARLIETLNKKLPKEKIEELIARSAAYKAGNISPADFHEYLCVIASPAERGEAIYPNLPLYAAYARIYEGIRNENLFEELDEIEDAIKERLFENEDQRRLSRASDNAGIILGLIDIKLINREYEYFRTHRDEFVPEFFIDFIREKVETYNLAFSIEEPSSFIKENLLKFEEFYEIALKRDKTLVDNTLKAMDNENARVAALLTGGFHTEGMQRILKEKGISYVVICPNITKDIESSNYIEVLTSRDKLLNRMITVKKE